MNETKNSKKILSFNIKEMIAHDKERKKLLKAIFKEAKRYSGKFSLNDSKEQMK